MGSHLKYIRIEKFPFSQTLSLESLYNYWKLKSESSDLLEKEQAARIIEEADKIPAMFKPAPDVSLIQKNRTLMTNMLSFLMSRSQLEHVMWGVALPTKFEYLFTTPKMDEVFGKKAKTLHADFFESLQGENYYGPVLHAYGRILNEFYGADTNFEIPTMTFRKFDKKLKIFRYYDIKSDQSYLRIVPRGKLKKLSKEEVDNLSKNFYNIDVLMEALPPELFEAKGFSISTIFDSTKRQSISSLKDKLLEKDAIISKDHFRQLEKEIQSLLMLSDLKLGVAAANFEGQEVQDSLNISSMLLDPSFICNNSAGSIFEKVYTELRPIIINDLENLQNKTPVEEALIKKGFKSYLIIPLLYEENLVGVLELGSPNINDLNQLTMINMHYVIPVFTVAALRVLDDLNNKVKAKIQEEFTTIHPVVEWKFKEAASSIITEEQAGTESGIEPIVFSDVYPLYGAIDIRSSTHERNKAIKNDLAKQLNLADKILEMADKIKQMPVFNQLRFEIDEQLNKLKKGLFSGDEARIIEFLKREVEPVFKHLKEAVPEINDQILNYEGKIDPEHGILYKERNDFEVSIGMINDAISAVLDEQENSAQHMFPHYFEKYRTDGIEYNIYIGQSILEKLTFDPVYLKNLRLWQLIVMCQIARKTAEIKSKIPIQLDTTQLVLIHSNSLSIRFREDEKKFDVEGGYNIRYEITKKRIDKAIIKGTNERLTQPGSIAIIYSQPDEFMEYKKYIDYLRSINYLTGDPENVELEDMQGVYGLQALRVKVNLGNTSKNELNSMEKIVDEAKKIIL